MGFLCSLSQTRFKRKLNEGGVVDSNSVIFHFLLPSLFAAIFSAVLQGIGQTAASYTVGANTSAYGALKQSGRSETVQGGYQMAGWCISVGIGAVGGLVIGLIYKLVNSNFQNSEDFFNDGTFYVSPKLAEEKPQQQDNRETAKE